MVGSLDVVPGSVDRWRARSVAPGVGIPLPHGDDEVSRNQVVSTFIDSPAVWFTTMPPAIRCIHCEQMTEVDLPDDATVVGFTESLHKRSGQWKTVTCEHCNTSFGVQLSSAVTDRV